MGLFADSLRSELTNCVKVEVRVSAPRALLRSLKQDHTPTVPLPTFDKMLDPLLVIAAKDLLTRQTASEAMSQHFSLTEQERNARIPSGQSAFVHNRMGSEL